MKLALAALLIAASAVPVDAKPSRYSSRPGWAEEEKCYRTEYSEEYVPGTSKFPGHVKTRREKVRRLYPPPMAQHQRNHLGHGN